MLVSSHKYDSTFLIPDNSKPKSPKLGFLKAKKAPEGLFQHIIGRARG